MIIGVIEKQPYEEFPTEADFAPWLKTGETLNVGPTVTARNADTGADASGAVLLGSAIVSGSKVIQQVKNGAILTAYIEEFRVVTSLGNKYEAEIRLAVREY